MTKAAEAGEAVLMYCKVGKDRTGLLAALIAASCDASDDDILVDYHMCGPSADVLALPSACACVHVCVCMCTCVCACVHACVRVHVHVHVCMSACKPQKDGCKQEGVARCV